MTPYAPSWTARFAARREPRACAQQIQGTVARLPHRQQTSIADGPGPASHFLPKSIAGEIRLGLGRHGFAEPL
jgi:hypothetical protein